MKEILIGCAGAIALLGIILGGLWLVCREMLRDDEDVRKLTDRWRSQDRWRDGK